MGHGAAIGLWLRRPRSLDTSHPPGSTPHHPAPRNSLKGWRKCAPLAVTLPRGPPIKDQTRTTKGQQGGRSDLSLQLRQGPLCQVNTADVLALDQWLMQ